MYQHKERSTIQSRKSSDHTTKTSQTAFTNRLVDDAKRRKEKKDELEIQKMKRDAEVDKEYLTF